MNSLGFCRDPLPCTRRLNRDSQTSKALNPETLNPQQKSWGSVEVPTPWHDLNMQTLLGLYRV